MIARYLQIENELDSSIFLFGARQTGKSTLLRNQLKGAIYIDLLDSELLMRFRSKPNLLYEMLQDKDEQTVVVIDEIPEVPELLNEVHRLISEKGIKFVLCGSSARKLKRKGHNTLGGRALPCYFFPLVSAEIPNFDLDKALLHGMLPTHYFAKNPQRLLAAYIDVYLKEDILQESIVRQLGTFQRFLEVAALSNGEMINYSNIATDCGIKVHTVRAYFDILEDTLIGYRIPAYTQTIKRRLIQAPKFYFFDVGLPQYLLNRTTLAQGTIEYGHAFEHFIVQELVAFIRYNHKKETLSYWRTHTGVEVDAVIGDAQVAIEIKSTNNIQSKHLKGLKSFVSDYPHARPIVVSLDKLTRKTDGIEIMYVHHFLEALWKGNIF
ncbi:MAG: ATP-binding protein [Paludibacteraceae bacterium]|nr:ATP-binding protein [Paludibacteraceae bacterium]